MADGKYKMRTISRLTGHSPEVLRAWERRYGFLEPERGSGGHRLYTEADRRVLDRVAVLLREGRAIGEVALMGRELLLETAGESGLGAGRPAPAETLDALREQVVGAAVRIDAAPIREALDQAFAQCSPEVVIEQVILVAAREIGELWASGKCSVAGEHLASGIFIGRLAQLIRASRPAGGAPAVICACFPDEHHEIGALLSAYYLTRCGLDVSYLGASLPFPDLELAIERLRPVAVYLSVSRASTFETHRHRLPSLLERWAPGVGFVIGGAGAPDADEALEGLGARLWPNGLAAAQARQLLPPGLGA